MTQSVKTARLRCGIVPFTRLPWHGEGHMLGIIARREFITLLGGAAAWPLAARAQQAGKVWRIGHIGGGSRAALSDIAAAFPQGMRELGYIEGKDFVIEWRWADGHYERYSEFAAEHLRLKVDLFLLGTGNALRAVQRATATGPIVFV